MWGSHPPFPERKMIFIHHNDKHWEQTQRTGNFSNWHAVVFNNWPLPRCLSTNGYIYLRDCHYFIDTNRVFLICNYSTIAHQLWNHKCGGTPRCTGECHRQAVWIVFHVIEAKLLEVTEIIPITDPLDRSAMFSEWWASLLHLHQAWYNLSNGIWFRSALRTMDAVKPSPRWVKLWLEGSLWHTQREISCQATRGCVCCSSGNTHYSNCAAFP